MELQIRDRLAVVVREGLKGNHLLFALPDLAAASAPDEVAEGRLVVDPSVAGELGSAGLRLAKASSIEDARHLIEELTPACRAALAQLYLRFLARCAAARGDVN